MYNEKHYSITEVSVLWGISQELARELFRHENDVLIIERPAIRRVKRAYTTLRIPESVVKRVHGKLSKRAA